MSAKKKKKLIFKKAREFQFGDILYSIKWKNKKFKLEDGRNAHHRAETEHPLSKEKPEIRIAPDAWKTQLSLLQTIIDESVHAFPELNGLENSFVDVFSDQLGILLQLIGFHLDEEEKISKS